MNQEQTTDLIQRTGSLLTRLPVAKRNKILTPLLHEIKKHFQMEVPEEGIVLISHWIEDCLRKGSTPKANHFFNLLTLKQQTCFVEDFYRRKSEEIRWKYPWKVKDKIQFLQWMERTISDSSNAAILHPIIEYCLQAKELRERCDSIKDIFAKLNNEGKSIIQEQL